MFMRKRGAVLIFSNIVAFAIFAMLTSFGMYTGYYTINAWKAGKVKAQADEIDRSLFHYAQYHKGVKDNTIVYDEAKSKLKYRSSQDYPLAIDSFSQISEKGAGTGTQEFFNFGIEFCKSGENAKDNPYKFKYTPLDGNGGTVNAGSDDPIAFYNLEVYYKNGMGELIRYVSPRSYETVKNLDGKF